MSSEIELENMLFVAVKAGNVQAVKDLVENGADVSSDNNYALRLASELNNTKIIKYLLSKGADVNDGGDDNAVFRAMRARNFYVFLSFLGSRASFVTLTKLLDLAIAENDEGKIIMVKYAKQKAHMKKVLGEKTYRQMYG